MPTAEDLFNFALSTCRWHIPDPPASIPILHSAPATTNLHCVSLLLFPQLSPTNAPQAGILEAGAAPTDCSLLREAPAGAVQMVAAAAHRFTFTVSSIRGARGMRPARTRRGMGCSSSSWTVGLMLANAEEFGVCSFVFMVLGPARASPKRGQMA